MLLFCFSLRDCVSINEEWGNQNYMYGALKLLISLLPNTSFFIMTHR